MSPKAMLLTLSSPSLPPRGVSSTAGTLCLWPLSPEGDYFTSYPGEKDSHVLVLKLSPSFLVPWRCPNLLSKRVGCLCPGC